MREMKSPFFLLFRADKNYGKEEKKTYRFDEWANKFDVYWRFYRKT